MRMKKFSKFFMSMLAMCTIAACSNDELGNEPVVDPGASTDAVYLSVKVQLPTGAGTRSETLPEGGSNNGTEIGNDNENKVNSVLLVLAESHEDEDGNSTEDDYKFIGCAEKSAKDLTQTNDIATAVQSISKSVLSTYYGSTGVLTGGKEIIKVFVFCNPTDALKRIFAGISQGDKTWYDQICTISEEPNGTCDNAAIWGGTNHNGGFLMSSYEIAKKQFPTHFSDWDKFTTVETPFNLSGNNTGLTGSGMDGSTTINNGNPVKVERSVARFDFKDGSGKTGDQANTYDVVFDETRENCLVQIKLTKMALVNMSKNFYYLRRVSDNGLKNGENYGLCGLEYDDNTNANYVVDTDAAEKNSGSIIDNNNYANYFNFCLGHKPTDGDWTIDPTARDQWYTSTISTVLDDGSNDIDDPKTDDSGWYEENKSHDGYKIWRYVTENTIPGETSNQKHGISTGIVFKGKMVATEHDKTSKLYEALMSTAEISDENPILYAYGTDLFVTWKEVRAMAIEQGETSPMYKAVFGEQQTSYKKPVAEVKEGDNIKTPAVYSENPESPDFKWNAWYNNTEGRKDTDLKIFKQAATAIGCTLYERSEDGSDKGYYCYYYYWNRHNDNENNAVMGPMEFAVVRNNVYKLAVTSISKLGHPRISENDPDPEDPDNPDEDGDVYLRVSVQVLPWVVRINDIKF